LTNLLLFILEHPLQTRQIFSLACAAFYPFL